MLPFEFTVVGKPISHQTKDKSRWQAWKETGRSRAQTVWLGSPAGTNLRVTITHFFEAPAGDESGVPDSDNSDNIIKPVRDALNGIVYVDDYQISDFVSRRRNLNGTYRVRGLSAALAEGFQRDQEFLHILFAYFDRRSPRPYRPLVWVGIWVWFSTILGFPCTDLRLVRINRLLL
ncbi:MAG TPA: RusA family crossover junction endodeoxyribonuclease [Cyanobacteria bacterium UBA8156]|nr:RusA family crossover junction endodeoxyribonuclease [Cyanobacteria bacterium UBA8156]